MRRNETESGGLTPKQEKALSALLNEPTIEKAAKQAGVSRVQLWRWLNESTFSEAYTEARGRLFESTMTALQSASVAAVETLREITTDANAPASVRVSAARTILDTALKAREALEAEERLTALEALLTPNKGAKR